ncbi:hypothetical protein [Chitinophaga sancti]|uniref:hypothetical protein n=1 Tax=Chitinophaga sancti TaxID=1004 RepID=UPI003F7B01FE
MMEQLTFSSFDKKLDETFANLSFEQSLFFGAWNATYLYNKYAKHLLELEDEEGYEILTEALAYLWDAVDKTTSIDEEEVDEQIERLHEIDVAELDHDEANGAGVVKLIECLESSLVYIEEQNYEFIKACAYIPIDVADVIMTNELGLDTNDPNKHIQHPLMKAELEPELNMMDYLKSHEVVSSKDKHLFREH